jgi:hypothetical protein
VKLDFVETVVARSHDFDSARCVIDAEDMKYISSLLRNNYSDPILATVREIYANAIDANKLVGKTPESIQVHVPTRFSPTFSIRDFGPGLSHEEMFNLYTKYGKSTKRSDDASIGGFGIGRLAPLSYDSSGFSITSFKDGKKSIYQLYVNEENETKLDLIFSEETKEENGLLVSVSVKNTDIESFLSRIQSFFSTFDELPTLQNLSEKIVKIKPILEGNGWKITQFSIYTNPCNFVVMGGIAYPLALSNITLSENNDDLQSIRGLYLYVPIGSVSLHHSRESLEYNTRTKNFLKDILQKVFEEIKDSIAQQFSKISCLHEANVKYSEIYCGLPTNLARYLNSTNAFVFNGIVLTGNYETRNCQLNGADVRMPVKVRDYQLNSRNGFISNRTCWGIHFEDKSCCVINDLNAGSDIIPRIRALFDKYESVKVVSHDDTMRSRTELDGAKTFCESNNVHLIKKNFYRLSSLVPVKMTRVKNANASIKPSFFFDFQSDNVFGPSRSSDVNDFSVKKAYFPVAHRKYSGELEDHLRLCFCNEKEPRKFFFDSFEKTFGVKLFGVSSSICSSKKFAGRSDFNEPQKYVIDLWNSLSDELKEAFIYIYNSESMTNDSQDEVILNLADKYNCFPNVIDLVKKRKQVNKKLITNKLLEFFNFANSFRSFVEFYIPEIKKEINIWTNIKKEINNKYPYLKYAAFIYEDYRSSFSKKVVLKDFANIVKTSS